MYSSLIELCLGDINSIVSSSLRGFIKAPEGKKLIVCDYSSIEARVLAWVAGETSILEAFMKHGKIYETEAAKIYGINIEDVTELQRAVGKTAVLALGYQGGVGAFRNLERTQGLDLELMDDEVEQIKIDWRNANPNIVKFWQDCNDAAIKAVHNPGRIYKANNIILFRKMNAFLWLQLPSGRTLKYPYPDVATSGWSPKVTFKGVNSITKKWETQSSYGGKWTENICQSIARDILAEAMFRLEDKGYEVIMHVHDEIICECDIDFGSIEEMEDIMCILPDWAEGLPIAAEGYTAKRFRK